MSLPSNELSDSALNALIERERTRIVAPLTEWHVLSAQLRNEGLIRRDAGNTATSAAAGASDAAFGANTGETSAGRGAYSRSGAQRRRGVLHWGTRFVAGAALLGCGVMIGRGLSIGQDLVTSIKSSIVVDSSRMANAAFKSPEQARRVLVKAQGEYQQAAAYLDASTSPSDTGGAVLAPRQADIPYLQNRLAALDAVSAAAYDAMQNAPRDPVVHSYYVSTMSARAATLHRLGQSLPQGVKLVAY